MTAKGISRWTGIGFSRDGQMTNSDIVTGWVYNKKAYVLDRFAYGKQQPAIDPSDRQDLYNISGSMVDDMQTIVFQRKLVTGDKKSDFPLDKCYHFLFPIGGGRILAQKNSQFENPKTAIAYHDQKSPISTSIPVCICDDGKPVGETPAPPQVRRRREALEETRNQRSEAFQQIRTRRDAPLSLLSAVKRDTDVEDPFACSDVVLVEVSKNYKLRVFDGFALSTGNLQPDEVFGGSQSLVDVAVVPSDKKDKAKVVIKKHVKSEDISDFTFKDEPGTFVVATGSGGTSLSEASFVQSFPVNFLKPEQEISTTAAPTTVVPTTEEAKEGTAAPTTTAAPQPTTTERVETTEEVHEQPEIADLVPAAKFEESTTSESPFEATGLPDIPTIAPEVEETWFGEAGDDNCASHFAYPPKCKGGDCKFLAKWAINDRKDKIKFNVEALLDKSQYTSVGFTEDGGMANMDAIVVSVLDDGTISVSDQFSPSYGRLRVDKKQNVKNIEASYIDGRVKTSFVRATSTGDSEDDHDLNGCHFIVFVHEGGALESESGELLKHKETPLSTKAKFCPKKCGEPQPTTIASVATAEAAHDDEEEIKREEQKKLEEAKLEEEQKEIETEPTTVKTTVTTTEKATETTKKTTKESKKTTKAPNVNQAGFDPRPDVELVPRHEKNFDVAIRIMKRPYQLDMERLDSNNSKALTKDITEKLKPLLEKQWKQLEEFKITNYAYATTFSVGVREPDGSDRPSILGLIKLKFKGDDSPTAEQIKEYIQKVTRENQTDNLIMDANAVQVIMANEKDDERWRPLKAIRNYAIIAAVILALVIVLASFCCCVCGKRKKNIHVRLYNIK